MDQEESLQLLWNELRRQKILTDVETESTTASTDDTAAIEISVANGEEDDAAPNSIADETQPQDRSLPRYEVWPVRGVPQLTERERVISAICEIIGTEGPVTWRRVIDLYRQGLGLGRLRGPTRDALVGIAKSAVRLGRVSELSADDDWYDRVVSLPGAGVTRLRQRGPRDLQDIPVDEIASLLARNGFNEFSDEESAFREVLQQYGLRRLTKPAQERLLEAATLALELAELKAED